MRTGIPSKKWSIPSFTTLPMSLCPMAFTAAVITGASGEASLCTVAMPSPGDQIQNPAGPAKLFAPIISIALSTLSPFGPPFTWSHVAANRSGTGFIVGIISVGGTMAKLVKITPGPTERGIGVGISRIEASDVGLSTFGIMGRGGSGGDELARLAVDAPFLLQWRGKEGVGSVSLRRWGSSEFPETGLLVTSPEAARERLGWLSFLNRLKKGIVKRT
jgi:hypothetical protein